MVFSDVAGSRSVLLQDLLLNHTYPVKAASLIGCFLALVHQNTFKKITPVRGSYSLDKKNWLLFLNMRTKAIVRKGSNKALQEEITKLYQEGLQHTHPVLIIMDCCPKNIICRSDGAISVIDFELASAVGDPAYDLGFLLGHFILFATLSGWPRSSICFIRQLLKSYFQHVTFLPQGNLYLRTMKYAGCVLLYRMYGASPAKYIPLRMYPQLKIKAKELILSNITTLDEAMGVIHK